MSDMVSTLAANEAMLLGTIIGVSSRDEDRGYGLIGQALVLRPTDFRDARHQQAWQAIIDLLQRGAAPNAANVYAEVAARVGEDVARYVTELRLGSVDTDDASQMVALVALAGRLRRRWRSAAQIAQAVEMAQRGEKTLWDADRETSQAIDELVARESGAAPLPVAVGEALGTLNATIDAQRERGRSLTGRTTGIGALDDITGGWQSGSLHLVGSVTGVGKTSFAINSALAAARDGARVLLVSLEMDEQAVTRRMATAFSGSSFGALVRSSSELRGQQTSGLEELPLSIVSRFGMTAGDIAGAARRLRASDGLDLLVVDHVQMLGWSGDMKVPRWKQLGEATWRLIDLASALRIPLVMTAQLNPPPPTKGGERAEPSADDIRESKEPHNAAGLFVVVHQKRGEDGPTGESFLLVQKNRFGPVARLDVDYNPATGRFRDAFGDDQRERIEQARAAAEPQAREPEQSSFIE